MALDPYRLAERLLSVVAEAEAWSDELGLPAVPREDGVVLAALAFQAAARGARLAADLGAGAGVSSAWIAYGLSRGCGGGCRLVLVDRDEAALRLARIAAERASGGTLRVDTVAGDALAVIPGLRGLGFAFVDVDKSVYPEVLEALRGVLEPRGVAVFHNALYPPPPRRFYEALEEAWDWALIPTRLGLVAARPRR